MRAFLARPAGRIDGLVTALFLAALAAVPGTRATLAAVPPAADAARAVDVGTFNVRYANPADGANAWRHRRGLVEAVLAVGDFWGLQEALPSQVDELRAALPEYGMIVRSRDRDPARGEACPILFRRARWDPDPAEQGTFWLSETPEEAGSRGWDAALPRIATFARFIERGGTRALYVYNVHLDHEGRAARRESASLLARRIAARRHADPVVVLGDFNAGPASEPLAALVGDAPDGLVDAWRAAHPHAPEQGTFSGWADRIAGERIDFVLVSRGLEVVAASIDAEKRDGRWPSDHASVRATVRFAQAVGGSMPAARGASDTHDPDADARESNARTQEQVGDSRGAPADPARPRATDAGVESGSEAGARSASIHAELQERRRWRFDEDGGAVEFDNEFSGARVNACERVAAGVYRIVCAPENLPINPSPWYAFRVTGEAERSIEVRIAITSGKARPWPHLSRSGGPFVRVDARDFHVDGDGGAVGRTGQQASGDASEPAVGTTDVKPDPRARECVLRLEVGREPTVVASNRMVGIAEIDAWADATAATLGVEVREIGRSTGGRPIRAFEFGDAGADAAVVVIGRQHPPEVSGTIGLMRFVESLAGGDPLARRFRETHRVLCVPLVNPDGVHEGQWRSTLEAVDANRDWGPFTQAETRVVRDAIEAFLGRTGSRPRLLLDFHATSREVLYLPPADAELDPPRFAERWIAAIEARLQPFSLAQSATHNARERTFKRWAFETFRAPGITFELGSSSEPADVARLTQTAAEEAMRLLVESPPAASGGGRGPGARTATPRRVRRAAPGAGRRGTRRMAKGGIAPPRGERGASCGVRTVDRAPIRA